MIPPGRNCLQTPANVHRRVNYGTGYTRTEPGHSLTKLSHSPCCGNSYTPVALGRQYPSGGWWVSLNFHFRWKADRYARMMLDDRSRPDSGRIHPRQMRTQLPVREPQESSRLRAKLSIERLPTLQPWLSGFRRE